MTALVTVRATSTDRKAPTRLSTAERATAIFGRRAPVAMEVAIALPVSWKPLVKSKARAVTITSTRMRVAAVTLVPCAARGPPTPDVRRVRPLFTCLSGAPPAPARGYAPERGRPSPRTGRAAPGLGGGVPPGQRPGLGPLRRRVPGHARRVPRRRRLRVGSRGPHRGGRWRAGRAGRPRRARGRLRRRPVLAVGPRPGGPGLRAGPVPPAAPALAPHRPRHRARRAVRPRHGDGAPL